MLHSFNTSVVPALEILTKHPRQEHSIACFFDLFCLLINDSVCRKDEVNKPQYETLLQRQVASTASAQRDVVDVTGVFGTTYIPSQL